MNICIILKYKSRFYRIKKLIRWLIKSHNFNIYLFIDSNLRKKLFVESNIKEKIKIYYYDDKEHDYSVFKKYTLGKISKGTLFINDTFSTYAYSYNLIRKIITKAITIQEQSFKFPIMLGLSCVSNYRNVFTKTDILGTNLFYLNKKGIDIFKNVLRTKKIDKLLKGINLLEISLYKKHFIGNQIKLKNLCYETMLNYNIQKKGTCIYIGRGLIEKVLISSERYINYGIFNFVQYFKKIFS